MTRVTDRLIELLDLDALGSADSALHRLDPRAKLLATAAFVLAVTSFPRHSVAAMIPFLAYPLFLVLAGRIPALPLLRRVALVSPFALLLALPNPLLDQAVMVRLGPVGISGGWLSFASILLRALLTASAAFALVAITGLVPLCAGLAKLGVPRVFVVQLLLLHRYLFVLVDEVARMARARAMRAGDGARPDLRTFASMVGHLLLRATDRAQRIHTAMLCRGFDGRLPLPRTLRFSGRDTGFALGWAAVFAILRLDGLGHLFQSLGVGR